MEHCNTTEKTALHALGLLDEHEAREVEVHLAGGCGACARELQDGSAVAGALAALPPPLSPDAALRSRILAEVDASEARSEVLPGILLVRGGMLDFADTGIPGIRAKSLFVDREKGYRTSVISMAAGATLPRHRHGGVEEVYMLEGDFTVEGRTLGPGDYCRAEATTTHDPGRTERGCTFLAVASLSDDYALVS